MLIAVALLLALEGLLCAAFPAGMKRSMQRASELPDGVLRNVGLGAAVLGVVLLWLIKAA